MTITHAAQPLTDDDDAIRLALQDADLPSLIPALAYLTGDLSLLREEFRPNPLAILDRQGGIGEQAQADARQVAFDVLTAMRDGTLPARGPVSDEDVGLIIDFFTGAGEGYHPLLGEELDLDALDPRAPRWTKTQLAPDRPFRVAVIGAGMSGLLAGYRLLQAGVEFVVLEKNDDVGGTWLENTYPGCRVDNPNHAYSYSFVRHDDWPRHYSPQPVLLDYFRAFADEYGVREHIRFGTQVRSAAFDEDRLVWKVHVRGGDATDEVLEVHAVVSAVGQLNRPNVPDIPGRDTFQGPAFHSARWDHDVDLAGKRVAVVGTGASAAQLIPVVAEHADELFVFQRTPNWLVPVPHYHDALPHGLLWLFHRVPSYSRWYRAWLFWRTADGILPAFQVDPQWDQHPHSVSAGNDMFRAMLTEYLQSQFADAPHLVDSVVPAYPPAAKRMILDNGVWAAALKRDNVRLITDAIAEITPNGIRTSDGQDHAFDVIVYGTGFQASRFLTPMRIFGRGGADLHERWDGDARAYLGITIPGFPNFFMLYGPNTNVVVNGSIVYFSECTVHYVLDCVRALLQEGHGAIDCRPEVHDAYNARIDEGNSSRAWGAAHVNSWYRNEKGRISQNWPFSMLELWEQTRRCDLGEYEVLGRGRGFRASRGA